MSTSKMTLLAIIEQGGYPDFSSIYEEAGYEVEIVKTTRKAISFLKKNKKWSKKKFLSFPVVMAYWAISVREPSISASHEAIMPSAFNLPFAGHTGVLSISLSFGQQSIA